MSDDILSEYGRDSGAAEKPRATNGGQMPVTPIPYSPPQGPRFGPMHLEPGGGTKGETLREMPGQEFTGRPGIGGTNYGCCGSQGKY